MYLCMSVFGAKTNHETLAALLFRHIVHSMRMVCSALGNTMFAFLFHHPRIFL
jgi:hypothetical protein